MKRIFKPLQILVVLALITGLLAPALMAAKPGLPRMSPELVEVIARDPGQMVRVIVQKANGAGQAEALVEALGGEVIMDLAMIQSFAARVPAKNVARLAQDPGISRVSIDAPLRSAALETQTVRDEFNTISFSNNDGTATWSTDWQEINESDGPGSGDDRILVDLENNRLRVRDNDGGGEGVQRSFDLSSASSAILSFDYRRRKLDNVNDYVTAEISVAGGEWVELARFAGPENDALYQTWVGDISAFLSAETTLRFVSSSSLGYRDMVNFDNVQIEYVLSEPVDPIDNDLPPATLKTVADDFDAVPSILYNNSGTLNWSSEWLEVGENDGATAGDIQVIPYGENRGLRFLESGLSAWRTADLSGATFAQLSFDYGRIAFEYSDYVSVEVSANGGDTWMEIGQVGGAYSGEMVFEPASYDISEFISNNTAVRFTTVFNDADPVDVVYIDNVVIVYDLPEGQLPENYYLDTLNVQPAWDLGLDGSGVTVAVVDSGITPDADFSYEGLAPLSGLPYTTVTSPSGDADTSMALPIDGTDVAALAWATSSSNEIVDSTRIFAHQVFNPDLETTSFDNFGHGTHVAGIIGGNGYNSGGNFVGVAPAVNLISLKISDDYGMGYESDSVAALEWIFNNKDAYNIRVVNLSIQSTVEQSYHDSALDAAAEILWFNGIVVVAAAGNKTETTGYDPILAAPANDPFVITVGATDEKGDADRSNDVIAPFSSYDETIDYFVKPDIHAPGKDIVSVLASSSWWRNDYPDRFVEGGYFRISGTSMATPMVAGSIALLLQSEPDLTPDQVKYRLIETAGKVGKGKYLDVGALIANPTTSSANQDVIPHMLLAKMVLIAYWTSVEGGENTDWENVDWAAVNWNAVNWNAVNWNAVNWNAVNWNAVNWNAVNWNAVNWNAVNWNAVNWNAVNWNSVYWIEE